MNATRTIAITTGIAATGIAAALAYARATRPPVITARVPDPAKPVELQRYIGRWYEIARHENRFERGMEAVTADYSLIGPDRIEVVNGGRKPGTGARSAKVARGKVVDAVTNAKLKLSFFGPFYLGDYWVLDRADDYRWAIVGEPSGRYLWILARQPHPPAGEVEALLNRVATLGYDRHRLRMTRQDR